MSFDFARPVVHASLWTSLNLAMASILGCACALVVCLGWLVSGWELQQTIETNTQMAAAKIAVQLREPIWNLDREQIARTMERQILPSDVAMIRVRDQFGGILFDRLSTVNPPARNYVKCFYPVLNRSELIGHVEVWGSDALLWQSRLSILVWIVSSTVLSLGLTFAITRLLINHLLLRPIRDLGAGLRRIAAGEYNYRLPQTGSAEMTTIRDEIYKMASHITEHTAQLEDLTDNLEEKVASRTKDLARANQQLLDQVEKRREAEHRLLAVSSAERRRVGRDLHDTLERIEAMTVNGKLVVFCQTTEARLIRIYDVCIREGQ